MGIKLNLLTLTVATLVTIPFIASAEMPHFENGYISGAGAWSGLDDENVRNAATEGENKFKHGWGALGAAGVKVGNYRTELELGYRENKVKSLSSIQANASGQNETWTLMANGLYDFDNRTRFTPYIGVGAGVARVRYNDVSLDDRNIIDSTSLNPAFQSIAGVNYKINNDLNLFANYQYITTSRYKFESGNSVATDQYRDNNLLVGLTYKFGAPRKKMEQTAFAYTEPQNLIPADYTLFFDWDSSQITGDGQKQIDKAVKKVLSMEDDVTIEVTGHADTSGPAKYNMQLSKKRAVEVKNALVKKGISASDIVIHAKGETDLLVPTADNVREPKNRRVVIVYASK